MTGKEARPVAIHHSEKEYKQLAAALAASEQRVKEWQAKHERLAQFVDSSTAMKENDALAARCKAIEAALELALPFVKYADDRWDRARVSEVFGIVDAALRPSAPP